MTLGHEKLPISVEDQTGTEVTATMDVKRTDFEASVEHGVYKFAHGNSRTHRHCLDILIHPHKFMVDEVDVEATPKFSNSGGV
jgi:uncharacterized protein YjlB